jgi:hypothetical protein
MSNAPRFQQTRKEAATGIDPLVDDCLASHYDVTPTDVYSIESLVDDVHDRDGGYAVHQILDYGGLDAVVDCGDRHVHVAKRVRPNGRRDVDLSLRVRTGVDGRTAELHKWQRAHRDHGYHPDVIAFAVADHVLGCLTECWLVDVAALLDALAVGLDAERHPTGDGTEALYVSRAALADHDCLLATFEGVTADG